MIAIVAQGICTMVMTLSPFVNLLIYIGLLLNVFAVCLWLPCSSFAGARLAEAGRREFRLSAVPVFFIAMGIWITVRAIQNRPIVSGVAALTVAAGALVYHFQIKKGATHES